MYRYVFLKDIYVNFIYTVMGWKSFECFHTCWTVLCSLFFVFFFFFEGGAVFLVVRFFPFSLFLFSLIFGKFRISPLSSIYSIGFLFFLFFSLFSKQLEMVGLRMERPCSFRSLWEGGGLF